MSKHSVTIPRLRVVPSWVWINRTAPFKWVGFGSPLAACSVYGDLNRSVHTVNIFFFVISKTCMSYILGPYVRLAFVPNMLSSWYKVIIIILLLYIVSISALSALGAGCLEFSLFRNVYNVCYCLYPLPLGAIGRLCFMLVAPPVHPLYRFYCMCVSSIKEYIYIHIYFDYIKCLISPRLEKRKLDYVLLVHLFVYFAHVSCCHFSLPLGVRDWLRLMIAALPALFY